MSPREREQVASIRFTKRRQEYLTRRWAAKHAVAAALDGGAPPAPERLAQVEVRNRPSGAPWVAIDGVAASLEVSLTDRAGWAVCLVDHVAGPTGTSDGDGPAPMSGQLGIDLELVEPRSDGFVNDYLTEREQTWVRSREGDDARFAAANLLWSAKEAALKVLQVGLRADTRSIDVTVDTHTRADGWGRLEMVSTDGDEFHGWWRRDGSFVLTIATRRPLEPPEAFPGSADLGTAEPFHSFLGRPLA
jgi:4'-phosphopantetheinyl transferase